MSDVSEFSKKDEQGERGDKEQFVKYRHLLIGVVEWAVWLFEFAVRSGIRLNDASPRNAVFEPVEGKWKVIDAGATRPRPMARV